jgi:hypothetical protein
MNFIVVLSEKTKIIEHNKIELIKTGPGTVTHTCNAGYLGGRDWENHSEAISGEKLL